MSKLDGKVALVSGSGRGIGRAVAVKLASEGARVVINDLDAEVAQETADAIKARGGEAVACPGDVTAPDFGERFVQTAVDEFGGVDIIVNNAGYTWDNVIQKMGDEQWVGDHRRASDRAVPDLACRPAGDLGARSSRTAQPGEGARAQGREHLLDLRPAGQRRAGELFVGQVRHRRPDARRWPRSGAATTSPSTPSPSA